MAALAMAMTPTQPIPSRPRMSFRTRSKIDAAAFAFVFFLGREAAAQLRLRGDALADTQAPVGLLVLRGEDRATRWLDAETVTWLGTQNGGDVLTLSPPLTIAPELLSAFAQTLREVDDGRSGSVAQT